MGSQEEDFLKELLSMFKIEAEEHTKAISSGLLDYEKSRSIQEQTAIIETVYREAHSLKGAARAVNLNDVETVCQSLETIFSAVKKQDLRLLANHFDVLHQVVDTISSLINAQGPSDISETMLKLTRLEEERISRAGRQESSEMPRVAEAQNEKPVEAVPAARTEVQAEPAPISRKTAPPEAPAEKRPEEPRSEDRMLVSDTIRIATSKLDALLLQAEEMLAAKLTTSQHAADLREMVFLLDQWRKEFEKRERECKSALLAQSKSKDQESDAAVSGVLDLLAWNQQQVKVLETKTAGLSKLIETNSRLLSGMVDNLLSDMKQVLMLPFSTLLKVLPKVVRDISRDQGKEVELIVKGSTIEIDRRILEELKDPFIHLLRNCVDHGIEKPDVRKQNGKSTVGTIAIAISQTSGSKVEILVTDDGRGIDPQSVKSAALRHGTITDAEAVAMTDYELASLVFQSDISTSPIITDISGRGLGLPIVREKVEKLGGSISFESQVGLGTTFKILLPVTLATFRGILVRIEDQVFVLPTVNVERACRVPIENVKTVENKETVLLDGKAVSLTHLADVLELPTRGRVKERTPFIQILVLVHGDKRIAFVVDEVMAEQEVLVKNLGKQLIRVRNIAGSTILGSNRVVPILNVLDLMKTAMKISVLPTSVLKTEGKQVVKKNILVAEDSITSRTLLKNILESAGYTVKTTVDGLDALTALKSEGYDLVVSDIEMPRMNGFELVSKIRGDKKTADLPVVLVTALESREDRERGIEVGANAYIVKRSFDQSNLLEVISKLI
jgi:two-component system, chemotaxis family, sensor kinase CheA